MNKETDWILDSTYQLTKSIASGTYGQVWQATNVNTSEVFAAKMANVCGRTHLANENRVYEILKGGVGVPKVYWFGVHNDQNFLVMDWLGRSLDVYFTLCKSKFTLKTVLMLADQMLARLEYIHDNDFIHRDLKPDNFVMGLGENRNTVFIVDFGFSKRFRDTKTNFHIPNSEKNSRSGTLLYSSLNNDQRKEQSRRDDMESLGYMLIYFLRGNLPWQGITGSSKNAARELIRKKKVAVSVEELCENFPIQFSTYLNYARGLKFDEAPNYTYCRNLFRSLFREQGFESDHSYDWSRLFAPSTSAQLHLQENSPRMAAILPLGTPAKRTRLD